MSRSVILILGMHRSGTSAITRILSILGAGLPKKVIGAGEGNEKGHWESEAIMRHNEVIMSELGVSWYDWRPNGLASLKLKERQRIQSDIKALFESEFFGQTVSVLKEPRISRLAPLYVEALKSAGAETQCLVCFRNPLEVADSLFSRDKLPALNSILLWLAYMLEAEVESRAMKRAFVSFNSLLSNPQKELDDIFHHLTIQLPFSVEDSLPQIEEFLSPDLKHHTYTPEDLFLNPLTQSWVHKVHSALRILHRNPQSEEAMAVMDDVRSSFFEATDLLYMGHLENEKTKSESDAELKTLNKKLVKVNKAIRLNKKDTNKQIAVLTQELEESNKRNSEWESVCVNKQAALQAAIELRAEEIKNHQSSILKLQDEIDKKAKEIDSISQDSDRERQHSAHAMSVVHADFAAEKSKYEANIKEQHLKIEELGASLEAVERLRGELHAKLEDKVSKVSTLNDALTAKDAELNDSFAELSSAREEIVRLEAECINLKDDINDVKFEINILGQKHTQAQNKIVSMKAEIRSFEKERDAIFSSRSWKITSGMRKSKALLRVAKQKAVKGFKSSDERRRITYQPPNSEE